jgi:hypothetical protein
MKDGSQIPLGRVMADRRIGLPVGPISPIYGEDWPYKTIPDSEVLWRYMDLFKFVDMMETSSLYLARPDRFEDPFEGRFSSGNAGKLSKSETAFRESYKIADSHLETYLETHRKVVFILCWNRDIRESRRMWNAYTKSSDSVAITTSAKALRRFTPSNILKSAVKYAPLDLPRTRFGHSSLFFYKPTDYAFEREFRLLRHPGEDEEFRFDNPKDEYRRVPIRLRKIVHRVVVHPQAEQETIDKVSTLVFRYLQGVPLVRSSLDVRRGANKPVNVTARSLVVYAVSTAPMHHL